MFSAACRWAADYVPTSMNVITRLKLPVSSPPCLFRVNIRVDEEPRLITFPPVFDLWRNVAYNRATCLSLGEPPSMLKGIKFHILHRSHARPSLWTPFLMRTLLRGRPASCESTDTTALPPPVPSPLPSHASPGCPLCLCCAFDSLVIFSLGTGNVKFFGSYWKTMIKSMKFGQDRRGLGRTIIQRLSRNKVRVFV